MIPQPVEVLTEEQLNDSLAFGRPYHPNQPSFMVIKKGRLVIKEEIQTTELCNNSAILIQPQRVYQVLEISDDIKIRILKFDPEFIDQISLKIRKIKVYKNRFIPGFNHFQLQEEETERLWNTMELIRNLLPKSEETLFQTEIIKGYMSAVLYQLLGLITQKNDLLEKKITRQQELVLGFIDLVEEYFTDQRNVRFYADKMAISERYLNSLINVNTGKTPLALINEYILNKAKLLLSSSSLSISEIAYQLKYSDLYSFSHFFKRHISVSPKQYRDGFR
ncbi:MAG: AraC family transcriptional regulator [Ginsengibacter sp.]